MVFPDRVMKHGPWSISKAGVIEKCSLQFDYKYGPNKLKELVTFQESRVGVAVHKVLEMALGGMAVKLAFDYVLSMDGLTTQEMEDVRAFYEQVERFVKRMADFKVRHGVKHTFIEERWGMTHDFVSATFFDKSSFFRGVVDFAMLTKDMDLVIIDHKTGKEKDLSYYEMQFCSYAVIGLAQIPKLRGVQTAINFTQTDNLRWNKFISAEQIRDELQPKLLKYVTNATIGLDDEPRPTKGWFCDWCGFKPICPVFGGKRPDGNGQSS